MDCHGFPEKWYEWPLFILYVLVMYVIALGYAVVRLFSGE